jgi:signal transduction histidine kinase
VTYTRGESRTPDHANDEQITSGDPKFTDEAAAEDLLASGAVHDAARWLSILNHVTEGAMAHLELHDLLRELLGRIREAMAVDNAAILLTTEDGKDLTVYAARGPEEQVTGKGRVPFGRGVAGTIAAAAKPLIIDDLSKVEVENPLLRATVHSLVGAPLIAEDQVIGVIHVDSARPRHFTDEDAQLLTVIAGRIALAIQHARLFEAERATRRQAEAVSRQLQALQTVSDAALAHAGLAELLDALLVRIRETMDVDNVAILLPVPDDSELTLYTVLGPEEAVAGRVHVPMGRGVAGRIAARREMYIVDDLRKVEVANPFLPEAFRSLLGVPLLAGERLVGVLHVATLRTRAPARKFTPEDGELLSTIGERIAPAIDRARVYEGERKTLAEAESRVLALQETTRRMDDFLSIASHELRTPLTSLKANVQMLDYWLRTQRVRRESETADEYLARAVAATQALVRRSDGSIQRLDRLIEELLDASRVREQRLKLHVRPEDLVAIVRDAVEELRLGQPERRLEFDAATTETVPVLADAERIEQVVTNYASNALKYSSLEAPVTVSVGVEGEQARVWVADRGIGIARDEWEHIWDRFYRVEGVSHQSGSQVGLGLGLYISRDIVERHGGQVGVESTVGEGSTFWFTLPLAAADATSEE